MVTEKDILYDVVAKGLDPSKTTLKKITRSLSELEISDKTFCPYCSAKFKDSKSLCFYIDRVHIAHIDKNSA